MKCARTASRTISLIVFSSLLISILAVPRSIFGAMTTNSPPHISLIPDQSTRDGVPVSFKFQVGDRETAATNLLVTAHSSNQELLSDSHILLGGKGTNRSVQLNPVPGKAGDAQVAISVRDAAGAATNSTFTLHVAAVSPAIKLLSASRTVAAGTDVKFSVTATGTLPLNYQWSLNGSPLSAATNSTLEIKSVTTNDAGIYGVRVGNSSGSTNSAPIQLAIHSPVEIVSEPQSQTVLAGSAVALMVEARGTEPIRYQWRFNGIILRGATNALLAFSNIQLSKAGNYSVDVSNPANSVSSKIARLAVLVPPVIRRQPQSKSVPAGSNVAFSVDATGMPPMAFRWQFNGVDLPGATLSTLNLTNVQADRAGQYRVHVQNIAGESWSDSATLALLVPPVILTPPKDVAVKLGATAILNVQASGSGPLRYQWYFGGQPIAGADRSTLTITKVALTNDGLYQVLVLNSAGTARSNPARISVGIPPAITQAPRPRAVLTGADAEFDVTASGTAPLAYQWRWNDKDIKGATSSKLVLPKVSATNAGTYSAVVTNFAGAVASRSVPLLVLVPVAIVDQPASRAAKAGDTVTINVLARGTGPISYQWFFRGAPLPGQTNASITLVNVQPNNAGRYYVLAKNVGGSDTSADAVLQVTVPASIVAQPLGQTTRAGETLRLFVRANGSPPLAFQWFFNGSPLPGQTGQNLVLPEVTTASAGNYTVLVSNSAGAATSAPATLTILSPPPVAALPAVQTLPVGGSITLSANVTTNGPVQFQWLLNGINIPGGTNQTLTLSNLEPKNSGSYSVTVSGPGGADTSSPTLLVVATDPLAFSDAFADRPLLTLLSGSVMGGNTNATAEAGEPRHAPGRRPKHSVWFSWQAPADGIASFNTRGSGFDTLLAVYSGDTLETLSPIAFDEDSGGFLTSALSFNAGAGKVYQFVVDSTAGATGHIVVNWNLQPTPSRLPTILVEPVSQIVLTNAAAKFSVLAQGPAPLSYQWFLDGDAILNATNATFTIPTVQTTNVGSYVVRVTSGSLANPESIESVPAELVVHLIATGDEGSGPVKHGKFSSLLESLSSAQFTLENRVRPFDSVARGYSSSQIFSTRTAVKEPGEPNHCGIVGGASVWSLFQPSTNGTARISTEGSDFDTILAIYSGPGTDFRSLIPVACDDNSGADGKTSLVTFQVSAGTNYFVVVDGVHGARGTVQLNLELAQPPVILQQPTFGLLPRLRLAGPAAALNSLAAGSDVQLSVAAGNPLANAPLFYQWKKDGVDLAGDTNALLLLKNIQVADFGNYSVDISNFAGLVSSQTFSLDVAAPPLLVNAPQDQTVAVGDSAVFSAGFSGTPPLNYQWQLNGKNLDGATNAIYSLTNAQPAQAGVYTVLANNDAGSASATAVLKVDAAPTIVAQPQNQSAPAGSTVTLNVQAVDPGTLSYQWRFKGVEIPGASSPALTLQNIQPSDAGDYSVVVANNVSSVLSDPAMVSVRIPINLSESPPSQIATAGSVVTLSVVAAGTPPLQLQWQFNGAILAGQTNDTLLLPNVQPGQSGDYQVRVSNSDGSLLSPPASLTVLTPPVIVRQPTGQSILSGSTLTLSVGATGSSPLLYQWRLQGVDLPGATSATLMVTNVSSAESGLYTVAVSNDAGNQVSVPALISVDVPLSITQQPQSQNAIIGSAASFSVVASASAPLTYQWHANGKDIPQATNSTLLLNNLQLTNAGEYTVTVSIPTSSITSDPAKLSVTPEQSVLIHSAGFELDQLFHLSADGTAGQTFVLQSSTDLKTWTSLTNFTFSSSTVELTDQPTTNSVMKFFRIAAPSSP